MNATQPSPGLHRVQSWPRLSAELNDDGTGTLTVNGVTRACKADSVSALRTGLIARAVSYAVRLRRPVRLDVTEGADSHPLAVRPEGYVQLVDASGLISAAENLTIDEGRCRHCRRLQPVTSQECVQCGIHEPLRVEVPPHGEKVTTPSSQEAPMEFAADAVDGRSSTGSSPPTPALERPVRRPSARELDDDVEETRVRRTPTPSLHLGFTTQRSITAPSRVVIGREPVAKDGQHPVAVVSPDRQLSRTHAAIEVDGHARIVVTDLHAPNGVELLTTPPRWLVPGEPTVVPIGAKLLLGDVECVVTLA